MKYLVIGDLHGNKPLLEWILAEFADKYNLVFVGDLVDSHDFSIGDQIWCVQAVLNRIENGSDDVYLWGNHETSYIYGIRCSGWKFVTQSHLDPLASTMRKYMRFYFRIPNTNIFVTHAGISFDWLEYTASVDADEIDADKLESILSDWSESFNNRYHPFNDVGLARGGYGPYGGLLWCDWQREFFPIPNIRQVFGHTHAHSIEQKEDNYNIDCLEHRRSFIVIDDGTISILDFGETTSTEGA